MYEERVPTMVIRGPRTRGSMNSLPPFPLWHGLLLEKPQPKGFFPATPADGRNYKVGDSSPKALTLHQPPPHPPKKKERREDVLHRYNLEI